VDLIPDQNRLENKKSALRREVLWASILFAVMFLTVIGLGSVLIIKELGNKETFKVLNQSTAELRKLLAKLPTTQMLKGYKQQTVVTTRLNDFLTEKKIFDSIELYDDKGQLRYQDKRLKGGELLGGTAPKGLKPGQQKVQRLNRIPIEVPVAIEPGKMGRAIVSVSEDVLARQAMQFRRGLITKLIGTFACILLMVGLAYLYVLRVIRMSRRIETEAQSQLRLSYLGLLSSGLAHEIKNPINSIQMNLQLLEEEAEAGEQSDQLKSWLVPIRKEFRRLERLVNDFLMYSRPLKPIIEPTIIANLFDGLASLVMEEARRKSVTIRLDVPEELPLVDTDEELLQSAMLNLVLNAIQAASGPEEVILRAHRQGDRIVMEICDQGPGIPEDQRDAVFDIFFTTKEGGTGLGLPISRRIIEGLGGTLELVPKPQPGSCFRASLPIARAVDE
jgi:signal transduction histidine kinase